MINIIKGLLLLTLLTSLFGCQNKEGHPPENREAILSEFPIVVWEVDDEIEFVYEVKDEVVTEVELDLGNVTSFSKTEWLEGNFSNTYPKGTKYFSIQGVLVDEAIAVQVDGQYKKAVIIPEDRKNTTDTQKDNFIRTIFIILVILAFILLCTYTIDKGLNQNYTIKMVRIIIYSGAAYVIFIWLQKVMIFLSVIIFPFELIPFDIVFSLGLSLILSIIVSKFFIGWIESNFKLKKFVIAMALSIISFSGIYSWFDIKNDFTKEKWIHEPTKRGEIVEDLVTTHVLVGMTKKEIIKLLGNDYLDYPIGEHELKGYSFNLGPEPGLIRIDNAWLVIYFNDNDKVSHYKLTTD